MKHVCTADVFLCHIYFELNYSVTFQITHIRNRTLDSCVNSQRKVLSESIRSKLVSRVFLIFDNVKKIRSPNDAGKDYLKTWDCWNSQSL